MAAQTASSDVAIVNLALGRIGNTSFVNSLADNTAEARAASAVYSIVRAQVLAAVDWPFARRRIFPAVVTASDWAIGTTYAAQNLARYPAVTGRIYASLQAGNLGNQPDLSPTWWQLVSRDDWGYVYTYPTDLVAPRELLTGTRTPLPETEFKYVEENDPALGRILVTDTVSAELAYTALITDPTQFPPGFVDALAWRLAQELAGSLKKKPEEVLKAAQAYEGAVGRAIGESFNANRFDQPPLPAYIQGR